VLTVRSIGYSATTSRDPYKNERKTSLVIRRTPTQRVEKSPLLLGSAVEKT
jgi:hypothetical protein